MGDVSREDGNTITGLRIDRRNRVHYHYNVHHRLLAASQCIRDVAFNREGNAMTSGILTVSTIP